MITDETLILYYYRDELTRAEREQVDIALEESAQLSERYTSLCKDMNSLREQMNMTSAVIDKQQWSRVLLGVAEEVPPSILPVRSRNGRRLMAVAASLLVFITGLFIGSRTNELFDADRAEPVIANSTLPSELSVSERSHRSFERGVATHLASTRIQLTSMDLDDSGERDALILQIITQNRLLMKAANQNGAEDVARLLRAFEPLLLSLSSESDGDSSRSDEQIREQLEFELAVSLTKIGGQTSNRRNEIL